MVAWFGRSAAREERINIARKKPYGEKESELPATVKPRDHFEI